MKILFAGGGTLGSVNPLIAVHEEASLRHPDWEWFWVGTRRGPERGIIQGKGIPYEWVPEAKFRRYVSLRTIAAPVLLLVGLFKSILIIATAKPDAVVGAGSFVSVPIIWAAWLFRKKILIHQQDVRPSLSNVLVAWCANRITLSFEPTLKKFPKEKSELTGNPVRRSIAEGNAPRGRKTFGLMPDIPVVLVLGGSSGALRLNQWVWERAERLASRAQVVHITGAGKANPAIQAEQYHQLEFVSKEFPDLLVSADVVITRAGIATVTELSALEKAAILVPIPHSHQVDNAAYIARSGAGYYIDESRLERAEDELYALLDTPAERTKLGKRMAGIMKRGAAKRIVEILEKI